MRAPPLAAGLILLAACADQASSPPADAPASPVPAASDSPVRRGATVARRHCALCHQVSPDRPSAVEAAAPSFMEIANLPGRSREYLREFATQAHVVETVGRPRPEMPTVHLSPEDREDVVSYVLAFQRDPATGRMRPVELEPFE